VASIDYHWHLRDLNPAQRRAVEHDIGDDNRSSPPLLIAAGAGTGKTKTLAHRVAHLILNGADPHRLLLLTFTRRAALEMTRRAHRILAEARGDCASAQTAILPWSGTFHSVGSRLLRLHALSIGLDPSFTILDRSDSADLLELVRTEHGLSRTLSRFPRKDTCLAIYCYTVNAGCSLEETLAQTFPWCADWPNELRRLFEAYVVAKQRASVLDYDDLLLYWRHAMAEPAVATEIRSCFDHVLVDEYQDTNRLQAEIRDPAGAAARRVRSHSRRRRCAIDLFVPRGNRSEHPRLSPPFLPARHGHRARAQLPLDSADPRCCKRGDRRGQRKDREDPLFDQGLSGAAIPGQCRG